MADDLADAWWEKAKKKAFKSDDDSSDEENIRKSKKKSKDNERSKDKSKAKLKSKDRDKSKEREKSKDKSKDKERIKEKQKPKEKSKRKKDSDDSDSEASSKKKKKSESDDSEKKSTSKRTSGSEKSESESESEDEPQEMGTTSELMEKLRRQFFGLLTPVEEDEMEIPESSFSPCRRADETQIQYMSRQVKDWEKKVAAHKRKAAPMVLIVCASGIRAVNLKRELAVFLGKNCKTAKLFSKHMKVSVKIEEQEKYLKSHVVHFGVGTPHRLKSLMELEAMSLSELTHVFVDYNWRDQKKRRLVDVSEARCELNNLLRSQIIPHLRKRRQVRIGLL